MTTIIGAPIQNEREAPIYSYPATLQEELGATLDATLATSPVQSFRNVVGDYFDRAIAGGDKPQADTLQPAEANAQYGDLGLKFDAPVSQSYATQLAIDKRAEIERSKIFAASPGGFGRGVAKFGVGLAASMTDPINVGATFVPIIGPARFAGMAGSIGTRGARLATGAIEGAVGTALIEPLTYAGAKAHQYEYGWADSLTNIAFGTVLGGGLHFAGGEIADAWKGRKTAAAAAGEPAPAPTTIAETVDNLPPPDRAEILRTAVGQLATGRDIKVEDFVQHFTEKNAPVPPPARDFELGPIEKDRYANYTKLGPADVAHLEGAVAELRQTEGGARIRKEVDGQGGTDEIIGYQGNTPKWFSDYNAAVTEVNKARAAALKKNGGAVREVRPLPKELAGAKPRYGYKDKNLNVQFASDLDKALYITAQTKKSKSDAGYREYLKSHGYDDAAIEKQGGLVRDKIKALAKEAEGTSIKLEATQNSRPASNIPGAQTILTRAKVEAVVEKMKTGAPLGKNEGLIAQHLAAVARGTREENVRQMAEYRANRQADRAEALREKVRQDDGMARDVVPDNENTILQAKQMPQDFTAHLQELDDKINAEWEAGTLNEAEMNAIDLADKEVANSENAGKGLLAAATCILRKL